MSEQMTSTPNAAVINPYALADLVSGRRIDWKRVSDKKALLEQILQTPYEQLFDPKYDSPLYLGLRLNEKMQLEPSRTPLLDVKEDGAANDLERMPGFDTSALRCLKDLKKFLDVRDLGDVCIDSAAVEQGGQLTLRLSRPGDSRLQRLARTFNKDVIYSILPYIDLQALVLGWTPPGGYWGDVGDFFEEGTEFFDPVQGAVANCYYISALSAVAWARPNHIAHTNRATGLAQQQFTNRIRFYDIDHGNAVNDIEVTDAIPLYNGTSFPIYCRSSEAGEIWPGVYEKAFAKWKTGVSNDRPDITRTAWGDPIRATAELTGQNRTYYHTPGITPYDLWQHVRENSLGGRTFNPMTACTYPSGDATPNKVNYSDANLVASHAYTVLGWDYYNGRRYIILRNPWGNTEATVNTLGGTALLYDVSWWRPIVLANPDGVFAIEDSTFRDYFEWMGVVR